MPNSSLSQLYPKYYKSVKDLTEVDVYQVHDLFGITDHSGAIHHASKKLLLAGVRNGGKPAIDDIREARDSLNRYLAIQERKLPWLLAANEPSFPTIEEAPKAAPVVAQIGPSGPKWVVLYYHNDSSRRYRARPFYVIAPNKDEALANFKEFFPKADMVWVTQVSTFKEGAAQAHRDYWNSRS